MLPRLKRRARFDVEAATMPHAWDCLAAVCIVNEAGGRTTDFLAENGPAGSGPIVAGAPAVFAQLTELLP